MKVLFVINGLGLGNSTRCHAIIQRLKKYDIDVEIITSGNGLWYFGDKPEVSAIYEISPLAYGSKDGEISIARTFASVGGMFRVLRSNMRKLDDVLDRVQPAIVVTDSDYNFLPIRKRGIPIAALNNADVVWQSYFKFPDAPSSVRAQFYGVECLDCLFHRLIPDIVLSPSLDPAIAAGGGNIIRIGPIVREGIRVTGVSIPAKRTAVMLSGSVFGTPVRFERSDYPVHIDVIGREAPSGWTGSDRVTFHGKIKNTAPILEQADLAVVNGGFSAVSELFCMRKPTIVVPVPRHAEQWVNGRTIEHLGVGMMADQESYEEVLLSALEKVSDFNDAYERLPKIEDGADTAAKAIISHAQRRQS